MVAFLLFIVLASPVYAGGSHTPPAYPPVVQGSKGDTGNPGKDGEDASSRSNHALVGADVLWHEWNNHVGLKSGYRFDTIHHGHTFDMAVIQWRVGKSPEDRRIDALEAQLEASRKALRGTIRGSK